MQKKVDQFQEFLNADAVKDNIGLSMASYKIWQEKGKENALKFFHLASELVPAYSDFLKSNNIDHSKIKSYKDFSQIPVTTKENYLSKYPINKLCVNGDISQSNIVSSSSGSSGAPFYWPRNLEQDLNIAKILEILYVNNFEIHKTPTLMLVCLGLGVWTAGEMMFSSGKIIAQKGHPLTIMSPGVDLNETIKTLKNIAPYYKQTFIVGYPAFVKDIIDLAIKEGVDIKSLSLKILVGGEVFTENWREYIYKNAQMTNRFKDITSVLGSSEGGIVGIETPICSYIRKRAFDSNKIQKAFFGTNILPSIVQYNPAGKFFEIVKDELVLTNMGGLPLIRYNTRDNGKILSFEEIMGIFQKEEISVKQINNDIGINSIWTLPFAYLSGRANVMATIYAVNVYPENIKPVLFNLDLKGLVTGRFTLKTTEDNNHNQFLEIFVELSPGCSENFELENKIKDMIVENLKKVNSEYNKLSESLTGRNLLKVNLKQFQDQKYFTSDKQKYILKS
ncbi:MAG: hypothetical protein ABIF80_03085 [Patescibacteria group bacterium]